MKYIENLSSLTKTKKTFQPFSLIVIVFTVLLMGGCVSPHGAVESKKQKHITYRLQAGINKGGMTENTSMEVVPGAGPDAFSGATRMGVNAGARAALPLNRFSVETGLDYMLNFQSFTWSDPVNNFSGSRDFAVNQFMWPLTLNLHLFRKNHPEGLIQLKIGHVLQYNGISIRKENGNLPDFSLSKFSNGATLGITYMPFKLGNGARMGIFTELYRGNQIYEDHYNQVEFETPGSSFYKFGIVYQLR